MSTRKLLSCLIMLLFLGTSLAGCLGAGDGAENDLDSTGEDGNESEDWEGMPDNRSGDFAAFRETNATEEGVGGHAHSHDYWQGRTRVKLFEATAEMSADPRDNEYSVVFRPPITGDQPALVYEGTASVEITISNPQRHACYPYLLYGGQHICSSNPGHWVPDVSHPTENETLVEVGSNLPRDNYVADPQGGPPGLNVEFLHGASDPDAWISGGTMEWGTPFTIEVEDPMWTDMPHATASLWAFKFTSTESLDHTLVFDITMDIVRSDAREIPLWPGHPDFYPDRNWRIVHEGPGKTEDPGLPGSTLVGLTEGDTQSIRPERLISYGTTTLHVWANITKVDAPQEPANWFLMFQNATGLNQRYTSVSQYPGEARELYWVLQVDPEGMDSPYQSKSRWEFIPTGAYANCIAGCFPYAVEYDMTIIATTEELPEDAYDATQIW